MSARESDPRRGRGNLRLAAGWCALAVVLAGLAWAGVWRLTGGHWERVESASMGTAAPVGTLLWVEPTDFDSLRVGDLITFHPPGESTTYSHRVHAVHTDGTISTKGQLSAVDPWRLTAGDVVGKVVMRWWGIGWLVEAVPVLVIGALALWLLLWRVIPCAGRLPVAVLGVAVILVVAIVVYRPLLGAQQLSSTPTANGVRARYVSTGLVPLRIDAPGGAHVDLLSGQTGTVHAIQADSNGHYAVSLRPHIPFWWWVVLVALCFVPAVWTVAFGAARPGAPRHRARAPAQA